LTRLLTVKRDVTVAVMLGMLRAGISTDSDALEEKRELVWKEATDMAIAKMTMSTDGSLIKTARSIDAAFRSRERHKGLGNDVQHDVQRVSS
jgi:hypothetical protein